MGSSGAVCGVGGWENTFGKDIPKKTFFFYSFPKLCEFIPMVYGKKFHKILLFFWELSLWCQLVFCNLALQMKSSEL